jgi:hypothetical protein
MRKILIIRHGEDLIPREEEIQIGDDQVQISIIDDEKEICLHDWMYAPEDSSIYQTTKKIPDYGVSFSNTKMDGILSEIVLTDKSIMEGHH